MLSSVSSIVGTASPYPFLVRINVKNSLAVINPFQPNIQHATARNLFGRRHHVFQYRFEMTHYTFHQYRTSFIIADSSLFGYGQNIGTGRVFKAVICDSHTLTLRELTSEMHLGEPAAFPPVVSLSEGISQEKRLVAASVPDRGQFGYIEGRHWRPSGNRIPG